MRMVICLQHYLMIPAFCQWFNPEQFWELSQLEFSYLFDVIFDTTLARNQFSPLYHSDVCGLRPGYEKSTFHRIYNGAEAKSGQVPWQAAIFKNGRRIYDFELVCGGTIITEKFVLTAAHCFTINKEGIIVLSTKNEQYKIEVGKLSSHYYEIEPYEQRFEVEKIILHDDFSVKDMTKYDIALVHVFGDGIVFNDWVRPACLPSGKFPNFYEVNHHGVISGHGLLSEARKGLRSKTLMYGVLEIWDTWKCREKWKYSKINSNIHICAGDLEGSVDSCLGDSGGPLTSYEQISRKYYIIGVNGFGSDKSCTGENTIPGVFARVDSYLNWIAEYVI